MLHARVSVAIPTTKFTSVQKSSDHGYHRQIWRSRRHSEMYVSLQIREGGENVPFFSLLGA